MAGQLTLHKLTWSGAAVDESPEKVNHVYEMEELREKVAMQQKLINTLQMQTSDGGQAGTGAAGAAGGGAKRQKTLKPFTVCKICGKPHTGNPPEKKYFKRDLKAEKKKLAEMRMEIEELEQLKVQCKQHTTERGQEKNWKALIALLEDSNKAAEHYSQSLSLYCWHATLALSAADYAASHCG